MIEYADGLMLIGQVMKNYNEPHNIQESDNAVTEWCTEHKMVANASKSKGAFTVAENHAVINKFHNGFTNWLA